MQVNDETQARLNYLSADVAQIEGIAQDLENMGENLDMFGNEMNARFAAVDSQLENLNMIAGVTRTNEEAIENITPEVEALVKDNEETKSTLLTYGAEIARIDGLAQDFENMGENLDNAFNEVNVQIADINGQLENLNMVAAVVRTNEEAIEELNNNVDAMATMVEERIDKVQKQADTTDADLENIKENLTNSFNAVDAQIEEINGQLENLNMVASVVRTNEEEIEGIKDSSATMATNLENMIVKNQNNISALEEEVNNIKDTLNQLIEALRDLDILPTTFGK